MLKPGHNKVSTCLRCWPASMELLSSASAAKIRASDFTGLHELCSALSPSSDILNLGI